MNRYRWWITWACMAAGLLLLFTLCGTPGAFGKFGIVAVVPDFPDTRGITSAVEHHAAGNDPYASNELDPWKRPFNYPRVWLGLSTFGITSAHATVVGHLILMLFVAGVLFFPPRDLRWPGIVILLAIVASPAVMLGLQLGNIDMLMFFLVAAAVPCLASEVGWHRQAGIALILLGFLLKIFPVFAIPAAFVGLQRRPGKIAWLILIPILLYPALTWADLQSIRSNTPEPVNLAFGRNVLWMAITKHNAAIGQAAHVMAWIGVIVAAALFFAGLLRGGKILDRAETGKKSRIALMAGGGIYGGSFLLANNWDYRLVFLALTVPLLTTLVTGPEKRLRILGAAILTGILASLWSMRAYQMMESIPHRNEINAVIDELANWVTFLGLAFLTGCVLAIPKPGSEDNSKLPAEV